MELKFKTSSNFNRIYFICTANQIGLDKKKQQAAKGRKCEMGVLRNLSLKQVQTSIGSISFVLQIIVNHVGLDK